MIRIESMGGAARRVLTIVGEAIRQFFEERAPRMAAALAFYTTFSLAPLLIFAVAIAGLVFGEEAAQGKIVSELEMLVGPAGAITVQELIQNARNAGVGLASLIGAITLAFGATGVVVELQDSLNTIWNVKAPESGGIFSLIRKRLVSFAMVLGIGFILLVSLVLSTAMTALATLAGNGLGFPEPLLHLADVLVSFAAIGLLFALIYKIVPDAEVRWREVGWGAAVASLLFAVGKFALGYYLAHSSVTSTYGAAGSLVALLLWVYYSAQILFFGAEITQLDAARRRGRRGPTLAPPLRHRPRTAWRV